MDLSPPDLRLLAALQDGLPLTPRPFAELGARVDLPEDEVIARIAALKQAGVIRRLGVIVRHRELGYRANAMLVWALPPDRVEAVGRAVAREDGVSLCYQRRPAPSWPFNLYCMIHGRDRQSVLVHRDRIAAAHGLQDVPHRALFSRRRFKQRGPRYLPPPGG